MNEEIVVDDAVSWAMPILQRLGYPSDALVGSPLPADASTRRYCRIIGQESRSWLVMMLSDRDTDYLAVEEPSTELGVVSIGRFLHDREWPVPEIYHHDEVRDWLLVEDLGDVRLQDAVSQDAGTQVQALYKEAMRLLIRLQVLTEEASEDCRIAAARQMDLETLHWEFMHYVEWGLEAYHERACAPRDRTRIESHFRRLSGEIAAPPRVLTHRDYHSRNLMIRPDGRLCCIDYQDAVLASPAYDLASLLLDSYVTLSPRFIGCCVEEFARSLEEVGLWSEGADAFRRLFVLQGLQRCLKAAGRFIFLDRVRGKSSHLAAIPRTHENVGRLLSSEPDLRPLQELLGTYEPRLLGATD